MGDYIKTLKDLKVKIFADGADIKGMKEMYETGYISGFTTNPTLMKKAGVEDFEGFAKDIASAITDLPLCFEVFADDYSEMARQAKKIGAWGDNIYVKIPVTNTRGESSAGLIRELSREGLKLNITAILTLDQVKYSIDALEDGSSAFISLFAGRIADTGVDPCPSMRETARLCKEKPGNVESLWASTRELLNIFQAEACGADVITVTNDILKKLPLIGTGLAELSLDTVRMFHDDATRLGYSL